MTRIDRRFVLPLLVGLPALGAACGRTTGVAVDEGAARLREPAVPTQAPAGTQTQIPNIPPNVPADVQRLPIRITEGELDKDRYVVQAGAVQRASPPVQAGRTRYASTTCSRRASCWRTKRPRLG